jgi:hypothetical protein
VHTRTMHVCMMGCRAKPSSLLLNDPQSQDQSMYSEECRRFQALVSPLSRAGHDQKPCFGTGL